MRFGIVGCGVIGPHHARAISGLEDARLVAVADVVPERARKLASEHGCDWHESASDLLARADVDAVSVCVPSGEHASLAIAALEAGKHVVVEKPVDVRLGPIDELIEAQRRTRRKVAVISQHRFDPASQVVHDAACSGRFGRLTLGTAEVLWWRSQEYYDSGEWRGTWELDGGGALMNQSIHTIDLLQWMMGPVEEIAAYTGLLAHERIEVEDTAVAALRFANGALGTIVGTTAAYPGLTARLTVHGDRGSAIIDGDRLSYFHAASEEGGGRAYGAAGGGNQAEEVMRSFEEQAAATAGADPSQLSMAHRSQIRDFIEAVREDREPLVDAEEGRKGVEIILAIYESARTGRPVRLGQGQK